MLYSLPGFESHLDKSEKSHSPFLGICRYCINFQNLDTENYNTEKAWFKLKMKEVLIESLKNHFLKARIFRRLDNFPRLTFSCSLSILSRWLLTLINQFHFTLVPAIAFQKLAIKQNIFSVFF